MMCKGCDKWGCHDPRCNVRTQASLKLDKLIEAEKRARLALRDLKVVLAQYEATGDHDHDGPLAPGAACPGGDCWVHRARETLTGRLA
jgi:hypothetical protein